MANQQLIDFIAQARAKKLADAEIRQRLIAKGWDQASVDIALSGDELEVPLPPTQVANNPATPDGALSSKLIPEGRPSIRLRRVPEGSTMEIRPVLGVAVPVSETSMLPLLEMAIPSGPSRPEIICLTGHWARVSDCTKHIAEMRIAAPLLQAILFCRFEIMVFSFLRVFFVMSSVQHGGEILTSVSRVLPQPILKVFRLVLNFCEKF